MLSWVSCTVRAAVGKGRPMESGWSSGAAVERGVRMDILGL